MTRRSLALITLAVLTLSCVSAANAAVEEGGKSRIRVFGQNGALVDLFVGSACIPNAAGVRVSGGMSDAFGSMRGSVLSLTVGIAQTETTKNLAAKNGLLSKAYYREYEIPAGVPTSGFL